MLQPEPVNRPSNPVVAYLGLGSSLGDRAGSLRSALRRLTDRGLIVHAVSPVYESPHLGLRPGDAKRYPAHLNIVAEVGAAVSAEGLLDLVQAIENEGGRIRSERWGPRTIDIDLLDFAGMEISTDRLTLPHPAIAARAFVAIPLLDVAPDFKMPDQTLLRDRIDRQLIAEQGIRPTHEQVWP